jgi:peptidyl-tRNA hydrolase, PTH1 family
VKIAVGLGNPGREYAQTRHNVGWMVLDDMSSGSQFGEEEFTCGGVLLAARRLSLFKPLGFMNRSGPPVAKLLNRQQIGIDDLLVLVDDVNLPLGVVRLRAGGSAGGHNGLRSLIEALGTDRFARLRMGVGAPDVPHRLKDYVLDRFTDDELPALQEVKTTAADAVWCWLHRGIEATMTQYNRKPA